MGEIGREMVFSNFVIVHQEISSLIFNLLLDSLKMTIDLEEEDKEAVEAGLEEVKEGIEVIEENIEEELVEVDKEVLIEEDIEVLVEAEAVEVEILTYQILNIS